MLVNLVLFPSVYIKASLDGLLAFSINLLPALLPFVIFTKMLTSLGAMEKVCTKRFAFFGNIYKTSTLSFYVFLMAIISGYPLGAKMISDLYHMGKISKTDAVRMSSFCVTSGPMFIIGSVGVAMFGSAKLGAIIYLAHILGALLNGFIYRKFKISEDLTAENHSEKNTTFSEIISSSVMSMLSVGAIVCMFFVIITALKPLFSLFPSGIIPLFEGLIEITKGCLDMAGLSDLLKIVFATFTISFGGFSTIMQSMAFLSSCDIKLSVFTMQKFTHAILSTLIALAIFAL